MKREDGDYVLGGGCGKFAPLLILLAPIFLLIGLFTHDQDEQP